MRSFICVASLFVASASLASAYPIPDADTIPSKSAAELHMRDFDDFSEVDNETGDRATKNISRRDEHVTVRTRSVLDPLKDVWQDVKVAFEQSWENLQGELDKLDNNLPEINQAEVHEDIKEKYAEMKSQVEKFGTQLPTFEELNDQSVEFIKQLQSELEKVNVSNGLSQQTKERIEDLKRQLEAGAL